ncbi:neuronal membrane glycoprotein M6-a-like isoform X1 [Anopheles albimanus]|uniref:neuronal membrane glycoprotein M6-a-like isoform X1 n=1 Tax=Anopheles albimanus TaxID=7167 RepID=UPI00164164EE|nr:neuronal membrane glycoprotein M6-a-like isoform X1 [Anopheles albimanus]XP_035786421.1 neuronal membrane glycoprotein M6-a-like isoform X1 [Anopheles albimanus]
MATRNRTPTGQIRDDFLLETNFDDDGALTRAYNTLPLQQQQQQQSSALQRRSIAYRSNLSVDRYSDNTLHGKPPRKGGCCKSCITRIPYATLIATVMCLIGVGVFCGTMFRGTSLAIIMLDQVFHLRLPWIEAVQIIFVVIGATMGALGLMILFVGFLATGATRHKVYRAWGSRVGGRISCAVFMGISYLLNIVWILILCFLSIVTFIFTVFWNMCANPNVQTHRDCIDLTQFYFMFPEGVRQEDMKICDPGKVKAFCKDGVEKCEIMFILATVSCLLIILSFVHFLMCLAANYAHIRDHEKFQELQEMQNLTEMEYSAASKDRF